MKLLAIDPGSNLCGIAVFDDSILSYTMTLISKEKTPLARRIDIARKLNASFFSGPMSAVSEEPLLLGRNNNGMQRLLGMIEFNIPEVFFIHPLTVKKQIAGTGKAEKLDLAIAAGERLKTDREKEIVADAISREAWDETDAVAIGLCYLEKENAK